MFKIALVMAFLEDHKWKSQLNLRDNLGLSYLTAVLRKEGYEVDIINAEILFENARQVADRILNGNYDMVGFSCSAQRTFMPTLDILKIIRSEGYDKHVTMGGVFATTAPIEILEYTDLVDSVMLGDGEITFVELAKALEEGRGLENIKSMVYRNQSNDIVTNPRRERLKDLDSLPFPVRDEMEYYKDEIESGQLFFRIIAGRGCNGTCSFCSTGNLQQGERVRIVRSPENVIEEIKEDVEKYNCKHFRFSDDLFFDKSKKSLAWLAKFTELLKESKLNITFDVCMRAREITFETVQSLVDVGLNRVFIGVESGSENVLKRLNKSCTVEDNDRALEILAKFPQVHTDLGFIMFEPEMSLEDLSDSFYWLSNHKEFASKHNLYNKLNIYYKTQVCDRIREKGLLHPSDFWDRHNYEFEDNRVGEILSVLEAIKKEMMDFNQKTVNIMLRLREMERQGKQSETEKLSTSYNKLIEKEQDFWLYVFEDCLIECKKGIKLTKDKYMERKEELEKCILELQ